MAEQLEECIEMFGEEVSTSVSYPETNFFLKYGNVPSNEVKIRENYYTQY